MRYDGVRTKTGRAGICPERRGGGVGSSPGIRAACRPDAGVVGQAGSTEKGRARERPGQGAQGAQGPLWIRRVPSGTAGRGGSGAFRTRRARGHAHGGGQVGVLPGAGHRAGRLDAGGESAGVAHGRPGAGTAGRRRARRLPQLHAHARAGRRRRCFAAPWRAPIRSCTWRPSACPTRASSRSPARRPCRSSPWTRRTAFRNGARTSAPSYLAIGDFIGQLPKRPAVAAFTATATERVRRDIVRLLDLRDPYEVVTGFDRPNLYFGVERLEPKRKVARIASYALEHPLESGIVYCSTRKDTDKVHAALVAAGVRATRYHAGMSAADRTESQRAFITDDAPVMVATNAFGMGIDKSNVRYVVHHNMPGSLEAYYQEAGRAGRDGEPSTCLLFWSDGDVSTCRFFIEQESGNDSCTPKEADAVRASRRRLLEAMCGYCLTTGCLRRYILDYFGDQQVPPACQPAEQAGAAEVSGTESCGSKPSSPAGRPLRRAFVAISGTRKPLADVTNDRRLFLSQLFQLQGRLRGGGRHGHGPCRHAVRAGAARAFRQRHGGGRAARIAERQGARPASGPSGQLHTVDAPASQVKEVVELLAAGGYLAITEGSYPVVGLGPRGREAAEEGFSLSMKRVVREAERRARRAAASAWRPARRSAVPARRLPQRTCRRLSSGCGRCASAWPTRPACRPTSCFPTRPCATCARSCLPPEDEFLDVSGVGATKLARYGAAFLEELAAWRGEAAE